MCNVLVGGRGVSGFWSGDGGGFDVDDGDGCGCGTGVSGDGIVMMGFLRVGLCDGVFWWDEDCRGLGVGCLLVLIVWDFDLSSFGCLVCV